MSSTYKQHMQGETENFKTVQEIMDSHDNEFISDFVSAVCCIISQLYKSFHEVRAKQIPGCLWK